MVNAENKSFLFELDTLGVGTLTLNRPEIHNAFDDRLILELTTFFKEAAEDERIQIIILIQIF